MLSAAVVLNAVALDGDLHGLLLRCAAGFAVALVIAAAAWRLRAVTSDGALAAIAIGTLAFGGGGWPVAAALIGFFVTGSVLSRRDGPRDGRQVLANGALAALLASAAGAAEIVHAAVATALLSAAVGAIAAAAGDTWSTEIGRSHGGQPRSIVSGRPVAIGDSGGVTVWGTAAAPLGGIVIGVLAAVAARQRAFILVGGLAAICGSLGDSLLGATLQARWRCPACGITHESRAHPCAAAQVLVSGWPLFDNDAVNFAATLVGAACGYILALALE